MENDEVASVLRELAVLSELAGENSFKSRAFDAAARLVERQTVAVTQLAAVGRLDEIGGLGRGTAEIVTELARTGGCAKRDELAALLPPGLLALLALPGLGARRVRRLWQELGVTGVDGLEEACRDGRITGLSGFGEGIRASILRGIEFRRRVAGRRLLSEAAEAATRAAAEMERTGAYVAVETTGELRRGARTIGSVELLAVHREDRGAGAPPTPEQVVVHEVPAAGRAVGLLRTTGSPSHWEVLRDRARTRGLELAEAAILRDGRPLPAPTEEALYALLGLPWIPPELREDGDEVAAAADGRLPRLVSRADLRGLIHAHTTASDGRLSLEALARACSGRGYAYLLVSDHSRSAAYAGGLSTERLLAQNAEARELDAAMRPFRIFHGVESDILADGSLDYPDDVLAELDFVIGSIHAGLTMSPEKATTRLLAALDRPALTILGHPSGELLLEREGYRYDVDRLIEGLRERGVVLEHNCNPSRLDPDWRVLRRAREAGVTVALCPDAHDAAGLDDVAWGLVMARKAWLEPRDVANCMEAEAVAAWLARRRRGGAPP